MRIRRFSHALLLAFVIPALVGLAGCPWSTDPDPTPPPPPTEFKDLTSIPNVLFNLEKAYDEKDADEYEKLFGSTSDGDPYGFEYVFDPNDVGGEDEIPPSWGYEDEMAATRNMFSQVANHDGYVADQIALSFDAGADQPADDINPGWRKVVLTAVNLSVDTRKEVTGEQLRYLVSGDQADLYFHKNGSNWKIVRWVDRPIGFLAAREQP